jgi:hypothetical protein
MRAVLRDYEREILDTLSNLSNTVIANEAAGSLGRCVHIGLCFANVVSLHAAMAGGYYSSHLAKHLIRSLVSWHDYSNRCPSNVSHLRSADRLPLVHASFGFAMFPWQIEGSIPVLVAHLMRMLATERFRLPVRRYILDQIFSSTAWSASGQALWRWH